MKLNQEKCHLLVSGYEHENFLESAKQILLGLEAVSARLSNFMSLNQRRILTPVPDSLFNNFIRKETLAYVFPCESCEMFKNTLLKEHLRATASYNT